MVFFPLNSIPCIFLIGCVALLTPSKGLADETDDDSIISFNQQIRPIISKHCIACHGPDEEHRGADLRLDVREEALASIEPGDHESSELFARIVSEDDDRMPPVEHADALKPAEIELIRKWIDEGAVFEKHWAFVKPTRPELPVTQSKDWARNEIDRFIAKKLETKGLEPSSDGNAHRLIRRLALDLTGLPPSKKLVDRYAKNPTDDAYEAIVDELLGSDDYGEHWAAMWMDIARYADTMGYAEDKKRDIWPWRDWVIQAFNDNMSWDDFTTLQLAGDLLPNATVEQKLATAFHRNTLNNTEGGTNNEEFRMIAVKDRISTTVNVWMGLTMRCAECHTHKYDPITQTEYYQFLDFFNQTADADSNDEKPKLNVFPPSRAALFTELDKEIETLKQKIVSEPKVWTALKPTETKSRDGSDFTVKDDFSILPGGKNPRFDEYQFTFELPAGKHTGMRMEVIPDSALRNHVGRIPGGAFVINQVRAARLEGGNEVNLSFADASADHSQVNYGVKNLIGKEPHKNGWAVRHPVEGYRVRRTAVFDFETPLELESPTKIKVYVLHGSPWPGHNVGRTRFSVTGYESPAAKFAKRKLDPLRWKLAELNKQRNSPVKVPVLEERSVEMHRETFVNIRGNFMAKGEKVKSSVPEAFNQLPADAPQNRLGVAKWLMADSNPLTARVTVNRFWARLFGIGIVETEEDFGMQGMPPVNQELLDWLAVDFRENGWDVKRLLKQMVMSSTYRQDNRATAQQLEIDPRNRYLARGPRFRLTAEVVRDQALAISGLLSNKKFGPPVYPSNPVKFVRNAFTGGMKWEVSKGEDKFRRAIYTFLKRSSPHPLFDTFDMASRTVCNMRRIRTNTPLQSFMTLNDEAFIEAAKGLSSKMATGKTVEDKIEIGLQLALLHPAKANHVKVLTELYADTLSQYTTDKDAAVKLVGETIDGVEEVAALVIVANVIMNLDEFLTR